MSFYLPGQPVLDCRPLDQRVLSDIEEYEVTAAAPLLLRTWLIPETVNLNILLPQAFPQRFEEFIFENIFNQNASKIVG